MTTVDTIEEGLMHTVHQKDMVGTMIEKEIDLEVETAAEETVQKNTVRKIVMRNVMNAKASLREQLSTILILEWI
jgi:hypothetical protein